MTDQTHDAGHLRGAPPAGRYTLDITEDKKGDNPITISLDIEDSSVVRISARDTKGNVYEGGFHLRRVQKAPPPKPKPNPESNPGGNGNGGGDEDEDDDDCQVCTVEGGRTVCRVVVC